MLPTAAPKVPKPLIHVSYRYVSVLMFTLPVASLLLCAAIGLYLHYDYVTDTHCKVSSINGRGVANQSPPRIKCIIYVLVGWEDVYALSRGMKSNECSSHSPLLPLQIYIYIYIYKHVKCNRLTRIYTCTQGLLMI